MWGPDRYAYAFREHGLYATGYGLWKCLRRFGLNKRYQRLIYLESLKSRNQPMTERNLKIIKRRFNKIKQGLWPGHIVALDTFYEGLGFRV